MCNHETELAVADVSQPDPKAAVRHHMLQLLCSMTQQGFEHQELSIETQHNQPHNEHWTGNSTELSSCQLSQL